jgi:hypothetical protein
VVEYLRTANPANLDSRLRGYGHGTLAPQFVIQSWVLGFSRSVFLARPLLGGVPVGRGGSVSAMGLLLTTSKSVGCLGWTHP